MVDHQPHSKIDFIRKLGSNEIISPTETPLVSVVMPTYNRNQVIARAIRSVEAQLYRPLELVIVDDASQDKTVDVLEHQEFSIPLILIRHARNLGGAAARNTGIENSNGDYIAFLDSDDSWHPRKIEKQIDLLLKMGDQYGVCYTGITRYDDNHNPLMTFIPEHCGNIRKPLLKKNCIDTFSTVVVRKSLLQEIGGLNENLRSCQDWDLWIRLSKLTQFAAVKEYLTDYSVGSVGRISTNPSDRLTGHMAIYREHLREAFKQDVDLSSEFILAIGDILMQLGRPKFARPFLVASLKSHPASARLLSATIMSLLNSSPSTYSKVNLYLNRVRSHVVRLCIRYPCWLGRSDR